MEQVMKEVRWGQQLTHWCSAHGLNMGPHADCIHSIQRALDTLSTSTIGGRGAKRKTITG